MVEVLNQLLSVRDWNKTFSRGKLCHICVLLDFCHLSLEHPGDKQRQNQEAAQVSISSNCSWENSRSHRDFWPSMW